MSDHSPRSSQILTFLYTDIEGSTRLWEMYPDAMESAVSRHEGILQSMVKEHGGSVFRTVGDGLCAVFGNPSGALAAALDAQLALQAGSWGETGALRVRMAVHTGEVEARGQDYTGSSLNRMGRLLGVTNGGQILLSHATQLLIRDALPVGVTLLDLGEVRLRDLSHPERVFQMIHPDLPGDFPPIASLDHRPNNLPVQPTPLIGREAELAEILRTLASADVRMLTLTGPGGTGKTRLALQAAADLIDRFEHGAFFVDLASVRDPESVLPAVARALGVRETNYRPLSEELKGKLQNREVLLVLDNFEQIIPAAPVVVELLQTCPRLKVLVTSREPLRVRGEHIFPVPPLTLPGGGQGQPLLDQLLQYEAIRLFVERAQAVKPDFSVTEENAPAVVGICARLDGLPLAIELAASRVRLFSPQALLDRLGSRLQLLKGGARDLPARQQTLRDTIGWSYELLDGPGRRLFELLSVFPGGCTVESAENVADRIALLGEIGQDTIDGLASLVDKSLVRQVDRGTREPRLVMLETIREYAAERLRENPEFSKEVHEAHAHVFADFTRREWERMTEDFLEPAMVELEAEIENVHAAWHYWVEQKDLEQLGKFTDCLRLFYDSLGWYQPSIDLTTDLLSVLSSIPSTPELARDEIVLQTSLASALLITKGYLSPEVEQAYSRALRLIEEQGATPDLFPVLRGLARYYGYRAEIDKAIWAGEQILKLAEETGDPEMRVAGHLVFGVNTSMNTNLTLGLSHLERGLAAYDPELQASRRFRFGSDPGVACSIASTICLWMLGYPEKAITRANETIRRAERLNHPFSITYAWFHTGLLYYWSHQNERAAEYAQVLADLADQYDFEIWQAVASCLRGATLVEMGQFEEGLAKILWGMERYQGLTTPPIFWPLLVLILAQAYLHSGRAQDGLQLVNEMVDSLGQGAQGVLMVDFFRLRGDLLLAVSMENAAEAENGLQKALQIALEQGANMLALRTAISLCHVWKKQGKFEESRKLMSEVFPRMTEGFSLPDVMEARSILEG